MVCSKCNVEMEKGIIDQGIWVKFVDGFLAKIGKLLNTFSAYAYKCPQCNKIEWVAEENKN